MFLEQWRLVQVITRLTTFHIIPVFLSPFDCVSPALGVVCASMAQAAQQLC